jgi:hypothetical protein
LITLSRYEHELAPGACIGERGGAPAKCAAAVVVQRTAREGIEWGRVESGRNKEDEKKARRVLCGVVHGRDWACAGNCCVCEGGKCDGGGTPPDRHRNITEKHSSENAVFPDTRIPLRDTLRAHERVSRQTLSLRVSVTFFFDSQKGKRLFKVETCDVFSYAPKFVGKGDLDFDFRFESVRLD